MNLLGIVRQAMAACTCGRVPHTVICPTPAVFEILVGPERRMNKALEGAKRKGREAFQNGESESACPYQDHRKSTGSVSWSRAFINAWTHGYRTARDEAQAATVEKHTDGN